MSLDSVVSPPLAAVTAALLARHEADRLPATLAALSGRVARVLVAIADPDDPSHAVAAAHGAEVVPLAWQGYRATREALLACVHTPWVLMLDADEVVQPELWTELAARGFPEPGVVAYALRRRTYYLGRRLRRAWQPDWKLALVRRDAVRIEGGSVHERLVPMGRCVRLKAEIDHYSYRSLDDHVQRMLVYADLGAADLAAAGRVVRWWDLVLRPAWHGLRQLLLRGAVIDGTRGWMAAIGTAFSVYLRYAKLYERQHGGNLDAHRG